MKISFNKGKDFYQIDDLASATDVETILNKLNTKTWNSIVSNMEDKVIEIFGNYSFGWHYINRLAFECLDEERFKRFDILKHYLYYYQIVHKIDEFIV